MSGTVNEMHEDLCLPAAEIRRPRTVALGLEGAGRSAEPDSSLFSAPDSLGDPSRSQSSSLTKGEGHRCALWRAIQPLGVSPKKHLPMCPRLHIQDDPSSIVCCSGHWNNLNAHPQGNEEYGKVVKFRDTPLRRNELGLSSSSWLDPDNLVIRRWGEKDNCRRISQLDSIYVDL